MFYLDESRFSEKDLQNHVDKHYKEYQFDSRFNNVKTIEEFKQKYDDIADKLSRKYVGKSDSNNRYVGYINRQNRFVKYDRLTQDFVVYFGLSTITMHKKTYSEYLRIMKRDFKKELAYNRENPDEKA